MSKTEQRMTIELDIPATAEERERQRLAGWDRWYTSLPSELKRRLSINDFQRLGDCFKRAFDIAAAPTPAPQGEAGRLAMMDAHLIATQAATIARLTADAERYRCLKAMLYPEYVHIGHCVTRWQMSFAGHSGDLDKCLDERIAADPIAREAK